MTVRRLLGAAALAVACVLAASAAWLLRDPEPVILARRGVLSGVRADSAARDGDHIDQRVTVVSTRASFELLIRRPARIAANTRLPVYVILGGYRRGGQSASYIRETGPRIVVSMNYPYTGDVNAKGPSALLQAPAIRRALYDTPGAVMVTLDYLLARPDVDTTRVELVGASFGAPFMSIAAALDHRVTRLWLVQAGAQPYVLINTNLKKEIAFGPLRAFAAGVFTLLASGPTFDPARWVGRVSPRPVVVINTLEDERIPRSSTAALFAATREPRSVVWLPGQHMQPGRAEVVAALINAVFERDGVGR